MPPDASTPAGLRLQIHRVTSVALGQATSFHSGGRLTVSAKQAGALFDDPALSAVRFTWASPGDPVRIVKVPDAVEPRAKAPGGGTVFRGFLGPPRQQGTGETHVLRGAAVLAAGFLP